MTASLCDDVINKLDGTRLFLEMEVELYERSPEERGVAVVLSNEEVCACLLELIQTEQTVVVGIDGFEGCLGKTRVQTQDLEELGVLLCRDVAITISIDGVEEQRQWSLQSCLQGWIMDQLAHGCDERFQGDGVSATDCRQVLVPNLKIKNKKQQVRHEQNTDDIENMSD